MSNYQELLKHPNWQRRRLEVLEGAGFQCINCGTIDKTLHVHHCYYEKGKKPWEYPMSAFRCLCEECHKKAEDTRLETAKILSLAYHEDEVHGYALGVYARQNEDTEIELDSYEIAAGFSDYWGFNTDILISYLAKSDGRITGATMFRLIRQHGAPTKPALDRIAQWKHP